MINTILVEDDLYIQKHLAERLLADGGFDLVGTFRDAFEAENYCRHTVRLVLMDVQTQRKHSGLAAARRIKEKNPHIKIVIVTSLVDPEILSQARQGAADSLWYKDHGEEEIRSVIYRTLNGEHVFPDVAPEVELNWITSGDISPRQLEMLRLYIHGMSYSEIARKMDCSASGVRWNFQEMIAKAGYSCKEDLIAAALESKLIVTTLK